MKYIRPLDEIMDEQRTAQFKINGKIYVKDKLKKLLPHMDQCERDKLLFEIKNIFKEMQQDESR